MSPTDWPSLPGSSSVAIPCSPSASSAWNSTKTKQLFPTPIAPPATSEKLCNVIVIETVDDVIDMVDDEWAFTMEIRDVTLPIIDRRWRRKVVPFGNPFAPAWATHYLHDPDIDQGCQVDLDASTPEAEFLQDAIRHHAYQRVIVTYYQLLAYWNENCHIERSVTRHQHGSSECRFCEAAHSALLPNVEDDFLLTLVETIHEEGVSAYTEQKLQALEVDQAVIDWMKADKRPKAELLQYLEDLPEEVHSSILSTATHLYHAMNATIKLPAEVNRYDCVIENALREELVAILNHTSQQGQHPYEALQDFMGKLWSLFTHSREQIARKLEAVERLHKAQQGLLEVREAIQSGEEVTDEAMLVKQYWVSAVAMDEAIRDLNAINDGCQSVRIKKYWDSGQFTRLNRVVNLFGKSYTEHDQRLARILADERRLKELMGRVRRQCLGPWQILPTESLVKQARFEESVAALQSEGSQLPDFAILSGKLVDGTRVPLSDEELLQQKLEVIRLRYAIRFV